MADENSRDHRFVFSRLREKTGTHGAKRHGGDEGVVGEVPLTFPIASQWAPLLSREQERMKPSSRPYPFWFFRSFH